MQYLDRKKAWPPVLLLYSLDSPWPKFLLLKRTTSRLTHDKTELSYRSEMSVFSPLTY